MEIFLITFCLGIMIFLLILGFMTPPRPLDQQRFVWMLIVLCLFTLMLL